MRTSNWIVVTVLSLGGVVGSVAAQEDPSPAEVEWSELQTPLTRKMLEYREMTPIERKAVSFQTELAQIGNFIRKYGKTEPDLAFAARIFMARSLLSDTLEKHKEALQLLQTVVMEAADPWVSGMAAVNAADVVIRTGRPEGEVRVLRELYEGRKEHVTQFVEVLKSMELQAALRPGATFPDLQFQGLDGRKSSISGLRGKVLYLVFFNVVHDPSRERLVAAVPVARASKGRPVQVLGISLDSAPALDGSLDLDAGRAKVREALKAAGVEFPIAYDGLGWESPLATSIGLRAIPATFLLDREGRIIERDLPPAEVQSFIELVLDDGAEEDDG